MVTAFSLTSLQQAKATDNPFVGTVNTGTIPTSSSPSSGTNTISLSGNVFYDYNQNGTLDNQELAISGLSIELFNEINSSSPVATAIVNSNGQYSFSNLTAGTYSILNTFDGNWLPTPGFINTTKDLLASVYNGNDQEMGNIVLTAGDQASSYNFAAEAYPIQLLSKRMLLASTAATAGQPAVVQPVPEPNTAAMLILTAITFGAGMTGRRYFKK